MKTVEFFYIIIIYFLNNDTEYRKLQSGTYEYEYKEYPGKDNFASNQPLDTTTTTSLGSTKKTSTRSNISPTSEKESTQTTHTTEMSTAESTKHY